MKRGFFSFFARFWVTKLKPYSGKARQSVLIYLVQNLVIGSFLEICFDAILSSKTNVLTVWQEDFSVLSKSLNNKDESTFWESVAKCSQLSKSKFGYRKLLRKLVWNYLDLKNECPEPLKRAFLSFLQVFEKRSWNHLLQKNGKAFRILETTVWSWEES